jgi:hypothetical protein
VRDPDEEILRALHEISESLKKLQATAEQIERHTGEPSTLDSVLKILCFAGIGIGLGALLRYWMGWK